jgi:predicted unusual protein kinase regulating ubiquinone biosynthesis (AarF/ABC1/UbiB family)
MQFYEGFRIDEVDEIVRHNIDTQKMIENLIEFYGGQLLVHGIFHADPHPGNMLVQPDARIVLLDYGMVVEITPDFRHELVRAVAAAVRSDIDTVIDAAYRLEMLETDVSPSTLREAAHAIISIHLDKALTQRQIQELSYQILNTFYRFPLRLPSNLVYILRTAVLIEGLGISYDPQFNSMTTAIPIYKRILEKSIGPSVWPTIKERITKEGLAIYALLKDMEDFFARAGREQLRIRVHPADMDGLERFISHLFRRVVMTISGVGLAIVTSILYLRIGSLLLLVFGLFLSFWLITLVFLLPNPQRYPFRVRRARKAGRML